jgi:uridine kinase
MSREKVLETVAERIARLRPAHPVRVGIDGPDAAGKTTFADELAQRLVAFGRPVVRASIDGFHRPASVRYRRGPDSPEGYYFDSFDLDALTDLLLRPLGAGGSCLIRRATFDFETDRPVAAPIEMAAHDAILVFDGVFLHRDELVEFWEFSIFLDVDFATTVRRAEIRDAERMGSVERVRARYARRYMPGQRVYFAACDPRRRASVVIQNSHPDEPVLLEQS